jgi:glycine/sarcosine N-methyltransferase
MLTETEFYDRLAESFDVMTDWKSRLAFEMPFLEETLKQHDARAILDCACGTGWHAIALAQRGYTVAGSDISSTMIARARENAAREGVTILFAAAGFQELRATYPERFDAVLCLGNSLPHVLTDDAALDSLSSMRDCLRDGGVLILHNLNYDKRWREKPRWFAVNSGELHGHETLIWRFADYGDESITFNIALFTKSAESAWSVDVQSTPQRPYRQQEIENLLRRAGFRALASYGSLKGETFDATQSGDLVVIAVA